MSKKEVILMEFESNPNIGLYLFANDKCCITGKELSSEQKTALEKTLKVPVYKITILTTEIAGVFVAGNNDMLIIPELYDYERKQFEEIAKKHDLKLHILKERLNTFGNNLCVLDDTILINNQYSKEFESDLAKETGMKITRFKNKEFDAVGAVCLYTNNKFFVSQELDEADFGNVLDRISGIGSANAGSAFVASGIVGNCNGVVLGSMCTTVEIQTIVESLEYL